MSWTRLYKNPTKKALFQAGVTLKDSMSLITGMWIKRAWNTSLKDRVCGTLMWYKHTCCRELYHKMKNWSRLEWCPYERKALIKGTKSAKERNQSITERSEKDNWKEPKYR